MTVYSEDPSLGNITATRGQDKQCFCSPCKTDGGGLTPIGVGLVVLVILDKFFTELGARLDIIRKSTLDGAAKAPNNGVFDPIILGIIVGREQLIDFAPTLFHFDFVCVIVKIFNRTREYQSGKLAWPETNRRLFPTKIERFQNLRELIIRPYGGPVAQQDRASDS